MAKLFIVLLLALFSGNAVSAYAFSNPPQLKSFFDAGDVGSRDDDWDDGTVITVGDGGAPNMFPSPSGVSFESLRSETASQWVYALTSGARRVVSEIDVSELTGNESSSVVLYFDTVMQDTDIEVYAYAGDGTVEPTDADIASATLVGEGTILSNAYDYNHSLRVLTLDAAAIDSLIDAQIAADGVIGLIIRIKNDTTTNDKIVSLWTGEQKHARTNRPAPYLSIDCVPNCTEPTESYIPSLPTLGSYPSAPPGICTELGHEVGAAEVTLQDGETLNAAFDRMQALDIADGVYEGGIVNIPYDVETVQCDTIYTNYPDIAPDDGSIKISFRGTRNPTTGKFPRFYCRDVARDGTIATDEMPGAFMTLGQPNNRQMLFENIEIDGYTRQLNLNNAGRVVIRNVYMHHAFGDGVAYSNRTATSIGASMEVCGGEHSFSGRDNVQHQFYMHRGVASGYNGENREISTHFYDNKIHSCGYSSCIKTIANNNYIKGNTILMSAEPDGIQTDVSFSRQYSQMAIDWAVCSTTEIMDNTIIGYKPSAGATGDMLIAGRNRPKVVLGCDDPPYYEYVGGAVDDGYDRETLNTATYWNESYWTGLGGAKTKITKIQNNVFSIGGPAGDAYYAVDLTGTFPSWEANLGVPYWMQAPSYWYERSQTQLGGNTYIGFASDHLYRERVINDCTNTSYGCPYEDTTLVFPAGEDTVAPWYPGSEYCVVENPSSTSGICTLIDADTPKQFYIITGTETVQ